MSKMFMNAFKAKKMAKGGMVDQQDHLSDEADMVEDVSSDGAEMEPIEAEMNDNVEGEDVDDVPAEDRGLTLKGILDKVRLKHKRG